MVVLEKTLQSPLNSNHTTNLKEIDLKYSSEGLMLKLKFQYFDHMMQRADSLEKTLMLGKIDGRRRREQQRMKWLDGITDSIDMRLRFEQAPGDSEGQGSLTSFSLWGHKISYKT